MYRGKNQEQYIAKNIEKHTYMPCGGVVPRVSKKGFLWGSMPLRKVAWCSFGVLKIWKNRLFDRGKNV